MARYAEVSDLLERHDARTIGDLATDDEARVSRIDLPTNQNVLTALGDASGDIDSALLVGNRYSTTDLEGLTGNSLSKLKRICCNLAMVNLFDRRPGYNVDLLEQYSGLAERHLVMLKQGENVFDLTAQKGAGLPTIDGPTSLDYANMNLLPDRTSRYYPNRASRLPLDRG